MRYVDLKKKRRSNTPLYHVVLPSPWKW